MHSCVTVNSIAIAEGGNGRTQEFLLGGGGGIFWFRKDCCFSVAVGAGNTALRAEANRS